MRIANIVADGRGDYDIPPDVVSPNHEIVNVATRAFMYPADATAMLVDATAALAAGADAVDEGADAIFINSFLDYGLTELRSAVDGPVMGAGLGSILTALALGERFSVVTIWPAKTNEAYRRVIAGYGYSDRCVSVRHVTSDSETAELEHDENFYTSMRAGRETLLSRIEDEMSAAVRLDGADVIILGCTCMSPVAANLASRVGVPVVDCLTAGYRQLELLVKLGLSQSRSTYSAPDRLVASVARVMTDAAARSLEGEPANECAVCVVAADDFVTVS